MSSFLDDLNREDAQAVKSALAEPQPFAPAVKRLSGKTPIGSRLRTKEWADVPLALRERAFFSAGVEAAHLVQGLQDRLTEAVDLSGRAKGRTFMDRSKFVAEMRSLTGAEEGDTGLITDITSRKRLELIYDWQVQDAYEFGRWKMGQDQDLLDAFPAQEFLRVESRHHPREDWPQRWDAAAQESGDQAALAVRRATGRMVALKDSGIWTALSVFGRPWPPFDWGSGMGVASVSRSEAEDLGLIKKGEPVQPSGEKDFNAKLEASVRDLSPELVDQLKDYFGDQVKIQDGAAWWKGDRAGKRIAVPPAPKPELDETGQVKFPESIDGLQPMESLGGSTGAYLVREKRAKTEWVMKRGASAEHLREEVAADRIYRAAGVNVPEARLYEQADRPVKLARFVKGKQLSEFLKSAGAEERAAVMEKIRSGFAVDALLGNWDVAGLGLDNILVDASGTPWRIDNGGALGFRAQGARKAAGAWGPKVPELESLLDRTKNAQTAQIFDGLTQKDIRAQVEALAAKRAEILAAAPEDLRDVLSQRLDDMLKRTGPKEQLTSEEFGRRVADARILGVSHLGDKDSVEDLQVLFYTEKRGGQDHTVARFKLTEEGGEAVRKAFGGHLPGASKSAALTADTEYWPQILGAIKTINTHATDGAYNPDKIKAMELAKAKLAKEPNQELKHYYLGIIGELESAMSSKKATPAGIKAFVPKPQKPQPAGGATNDWKLSREDWSIQQKRKSRGHAEVENRSIYTAQSAVSGQFANGATLRAVMPDDTTVPYALRGTVEISVPGRGGQESVAKLAEAARAFGIPIADASQDQQRITYLSKNLHMIQKTLTPSQVKAWREAVADVAATEADRVDRLKKVAQSAGMDLSKLDQAVPGRANSFGAGFRFWDRLDLPREQIEKELADYTLHHEFYSGDMHQVIKSWLDGGAEVTPTVERLRIGVPITSGASPDADLKTGGASYFFTRIRKVDVAKKRPGIEFKIGNLSRVDAYSYANDSWGDVRPKGQNTHVGDPIQSRGVSLNEYREMSRSGGNETIFKNGFHLLDDVSRITTKTAAERAAIIKEFKSHGYSKLPDGRKLDDVVKVTGT